MQTQRRIHAACVVALLALVALVWLPVASEAARHQHGPSSPPTPAHGQPAQRPSRSDQHVIDAMRELREMRAAEAAAASGTDPHATGRTEAPLPWSYGINNYTVQRPEGVRTYQVYVPRSYNGAKSVSLVLSIHGLGDNSVNFARRTNLTVLSEQWGFIAIFPQGSQGPFGTAWNAGTCCANQNVDDVTLLTSIVALVRGTFAIRKESIHSMGFSNGGFMTERLGCQLASTFTSIASVSGAVVMQPGNSAGIQACTAAYTSPTSILHIHGNADWTVPWTGDALIGVPSVPENMAGWVARNKCTKAPTQTLKVATFTNQLWSGCGADGKVTVELVKNDGGAHVYLIGPPFDYTNYILGFWNRVTPGGL
jgi:poly(3-hydroxybutyrate) depolymerase